MHKKIIQLRSALLVLLTHNLALPLLRVVRQPEKISFTRELLHQLPEGTLGKDLVTMLDGKNLKLLPHYARHDIKHIVLQYDTTEEGEVCLQFFMLGNKHLSFPVVATIVYGMITMPEYWTNFRRAYHRGAASPPLRNWQWLSLLDQPTLSLIKKINHETDLPAY